MSEAVQVALIVSVAPTLAGVAGIIIAYRTNKEVKAVHKTINGGLSRQLSDAGKAGELKGRQDEKQENKNLGS